MPVAGRTAGATVAVEHPGAGRSPAQRWHHGLGVDGATLARRRRAQALAAPVVVFMRDPDFEAKAATVLDLYARTYQHSPLGAHEYVISADQKPSIQARHAAIAQRLPRPGAASGSSTTTAAAVRWPIWPPTTSTMDRCSAAASPPPASRRSPGWSTRS